MSATGVTGELGWCLPSNIARLKIWHVEHIFSIKKDSTTFRRHKRPITLKIGGFQYFNIFFLIRAMIPYFGAALWSRLYHLDTFTPACTLFPESISKSGCRLSRPATGDRLRRRGIASLRVLRKPSPAYRPFFGRINRLLEELRGISVKR